MRRNLFVKSIFITLSVFSLNSTAQSISVIGAGNDARLCSIAAETAANFQTASRNDLESCFLALEYGNLKRRDRAGTLVNKGIIHTVVGQYQNAYKDYRKAIEIMNNLPEAYVGRGNIYFLSGKYELAIADYTEALDLNITRNHIAFFNRGMAYEKIKDYVKAEENYRLALEMVPEWSLALNKLKKLHVKNER